MKTNDSWTFLSFPFRPSPNLTNSPIYGSDNPYLYIDWLCDWYVVSSVFVRSDFNIEVISI